MAQKDTLDVKDAADSSTAVLDENPSATSTEEEGVTKEAASPPAEEGVKSIADAVREAADKAKVETGSPPEEEGKEEEVETEVEDKEETQPDSSTEQVDEKTEQLPFAKHPRWQQVLKERDAQKAEVERLKPLAESARVIASFCQAHGITDDDLREALDMARLARTDQKAFRERLQVYADSLDVNTGSRLPTDLQKKLDDGVIDQETAWELAKARIAASSASQRGAQTEQQLETQRRQSMASALTMWEDAKRKSDPDYAKVFDLISDRFAALRTMHPPQTPAEAVSLAEQSYKDVKQRLSRLSPKPPQRKVLQTHSSTNNGAAALKFDDWGDLNKIVSHAANKRR
jgi:hypothetical protein